MSNDVLCICPLYPFNSDCSDIQLDYGITIKLDTGVFRNKFFGYNSAADEVWDEMGKKPLWIATLPHAHVASCRPSEYNCESQLERLVFCFITALRVLRQGLVTPGPIIFRPQNPLDEIFVEYRWLGIAYHDYLFRCPRMYTLRKAIIPKLNKLLTNVFSWYDRPADSNRRWAWPSIGSIPPTGVSRRRG
jgi:hypothetical protein